MILPAALPTSPTRSSTVQAPAETSEIGAEFAALLGLMLEAGTAEPATIPGAATTPAPVAQPTIGNPNGNFLPDELPSLPATLDSETPEADVLAAIIAPPPIVAPIPLPLIMPPAEGTTDTPTPPHAVTVPKLPAQFAEGTKADSPAPIQPQPPRPEQASVAALPRLMLSVPDEAAPSASSVPTSPARARIVATSLEGSAAPTPTAPQMTFAVAEAEAPATSPPATAPNPVRAQAPHDFATLVDRLVEARDTARAGQAPQTVSASLAHADFGNIAIRFEHGGHALSVALSNPDPDFARAVQAAAPAAQTHDNAAAPGRQDASGQQQGGSPSGQSQQSQAQQRSAGSLARNAAPQEHSRDEQHSGRSGIFA